jgi:hypothetical protein
MYIRIYFSWLNWVYGDFLLETGCIDVKTELRPDEGNCCSEGMMPSWLDEPRGSSSTSTSKSISHYPPCGRYHPYA